MSKFGALLCLQLKSMLYSFHMSGTKKKKSFTGMGVIILMGILALYLSGVYSFLFASQLAPVGMLPLLIIIMPVMAVAVGFFFTIFAAQSVIFGGRDNDLMLSMPVSAFSLMLSRVLALYLENLIFCIFVLIPAGAAYLLNGGAGGLGFIFSLLAGTVILAFLPTLLSLVAGFILSWASSKFVRKNLISILLYAVFLVAVFLFVFRINFLMEDLALVASGIQNAFSGWGLPFILLKEAACDGRIFSLFLLTGLCLFPFLLAVWLFALRYKSIITGLQSRSAQSDYRLGTLTAGSQLGALLRKEAGKFFGTTAYLFNSGIGLIMLLILGGGSLVKRDMIATLLNDFLDAGVSLPTLPLLVLTITFVLSTVSITACSISLEGKQLWILKSAPIRVWDLFQIKTGFQLMLSLPCVLICTACLWAAFSLRAGEGLLLMGFGFLFCLFTAPFGLFVNLCLPKLDAISDMAAVKQSASTIIGIFAPMLLIAAGAGLYFLTQSLWPPLVFLSVAAAVSWTALATRGVVLFAAL